MSSQLTIDITQCPLCDGFIAALSLDGNYIIRVHNSKYVYAKDIVLQVLHATFAVGNPQRDIVVVDTVLLPMGLDWMTHYGYSPEQAAIHFSEPDDESNESDST